MKTVTRLEKVIYWLFYVVFLAFVIMGLDLMLGRSMIPASAKLRTTHTFYHHDLRPMADGKEQWGYDTYPHITNSLGFRDSSKRKVKLENSGRRILLMGDSFTEGVGVSYEKTFAGIMAAELGGDGVEVLNSAATSYSPKLYYLKLKYLLDKGLATDEVVVFMDISDIQDEIHYSLFRPYKETFGDRVWLWLYQHSFLFRYYGIKLWPRNDHGRVEFSQASADEESYRFDSDQDMADFVDKLKNSTDHRYPAQVADPVFVKWAMDTFAHWWGEPQTFYQERGRWTLDEKLYGAWGARGLQLARENMGFLLDLCREKDIKLTLAVYPWPAQIAYRDMASRQVSFWRGWCRENGVRFIDLFPLFINAQDATEVIQEYFIVGDDHWNAKGHELVARKVLEEMAGD